VGFARGRPDDALKLATQLAQDKLTSKENNGIAWIELVSGGDLHEALALARTAAADKDEMAHALDTAAAIELELGDLAAARQDEADSFVASHALQPQSDHWYVFGRLYELLGLRDDAIAAYRRVKPSTGPSFVTDSPELAAPRLKALGVRTP
jgi:hypothetical protein